MYGDKYIKGYINRKFIYCKLKILKVFHIGIIGLICIMLFKYLFYEF
jgi:hypothetical protein